ncbi:DUF4907 domain-containing protein [Arachidicoccus terrestris]|uniref:DUF4907 domain-containing protein n=1 Tax=Arachidicoccus terrestris TaxID=2875539 RepID=UPI001CC7C53C|nr:DUF4907 domain-containing protein [Arachidicoccus terrestris]UAY56842.1 DUF4907 domain-containing protein [Arachidicoccus terrestris]
MMHVKNRFLHIAGFTAIVLLGSCRDNHSGTIKKATEQVAAGQPAVSSLQEDTLSLTVQTISLPGSDHLWGYEIYAGGRVLVRQLRVPAVSGRCGFSSKAGADQIGHVVAEKLKTGQIPAISLEELKKAGVGYKPY